MRVAPDARSYARTVADAEIIAPGLRSPAFDRAAAPGRSFDAICSTRRRALDVAMTSADVRVYIDNLLPGRAFDTKTATCGDTRTVFNSVVAMKRISNNSDNTLGARSVGDRNAKPAGPQTIADLNRINAERKAARKSA